MKGRALTPAAKREIVERLLVAWLKVPDQRLGQLIANSFGRRYGFSPDIFVTEDETLADAVERFAKEKC